MSLVLGSRIPSPYYEFAADRSIAVYYARACGTCNFTYPTAEVPLYSTWTEGSAECCPMHSLPGRLVLKVDPAMAVRRGKWDSPGLLRAISFGAVYRRRECKVKGCVQTKGKWAGIPFRWSTIEVSADGIIVEDVTVCPKCGGRAIIQKRSNKTLFMRGYWARYYKLKAKGEQPLIAMALHKARLAGLPICVKDGFHVLVRDAVVPAVPAVPGVSEFAERDRPLPVADDDEAFDDEGESDLIVP